MIDVHNAGFRNASQSTAENAFAGSSLVPMLIAGLVLVVVGMIAVAVLV